MSLQDDSRRKDSAMPMPGAGDIAQGMHADGISGEIADGKTVATVLKVKTLLAR